MHRQEPRRRLSPAAPTARPILHHLQRRPSAEYIRHIHPTPSTLHDPPTSTITACACATTSATRTATATTIVVRQNVEHNNPPSNGFRNALRARMGLSELVHRLYHRGRGSSGGWCCAVDAGHVLASCWRQWGRAWCTWWWWVSRCDGRVFARFSSEAHHYADLYAERA